MYRNLKNVMEFETCVMIGGGGPAACCPVCVYAVRCLQTLTFTLTRINKRCTLTGYMAAAGTVNLGCRKSRYLYLLSL